MSRKFFDNLIHGHGYENNDGQNQTLTVDEILTNPYYNLAANPEMSKKFTYKPRLEKGNIIYDKVGVEKPNPGIDNAYLIVEFYRVPIEFAFRFNRMNCLKVSGRDYCSEGKGIQIIPLMGILVGVDKQKFNRWNGKD